jgi:DNA repair photolyase
MKRSLPILRGRGAADDLPNRFERLHLELEEEERGDPHRRPTRYFRDHTRKVITRNHSPDVGFDWSVNPYRGCEHGCVYCLAPATPVVHADLSVRPLGEVEVGDVLLGFDEHPEPGRRRKLRPATVEAVWWSRRPTLRIVTDRAEVVTTAEHRWLLAGSGWTTTERLDPGVELRSLSLEGLGGEGGRQAVFGRTLPTSPEPIRAIEPGPEADVVDIQTSTRTFFAAGLATHNCYARPTHELLGFSPGLDFESRILVKEEAPRLLRAELSRPRWKPTVLVMSGVTDPYQTVERRLGITRGCLEVLAEARHPVALITKSRLVERDLDLLSKLAGFGAAHVTLSITTLDRALQRALEPRASPPEHRLAAVRALAEAGVPVAVNVAPVIPGLTDQEIPSILEAAAEAGATAAGFILLRLPLGVQELFVHWLREHLPERANRVLNRIRDTRGGLLYRSPWGTRMKGTGPYAEQIRSLFTVSVRRFGLEKRSLVLSADAFRRPAPPIRGGEGPQLALDLRGG